jgi:phytoene dehydrogenase-like protein
MRNHIAWAYCHVPNGWDGDATEAIENQIERFAPGFKDRIVARATHGPRELEAWDANLVGGDVNGGAITLKQMFGPGRWSFNPWGTPVKDLYICSASAPPGGGVHGMVGFHAARAALKRTFGRG